jgi:hypothetical protein
MKPSTTRWKHKIAEIRLQHTWKQRKLEQRRLHAPCTPANWQMLAAHTHRHTHTHTPVFLASRFSTTRTSKEVEEKDLKVSPRTIRNENINTKQMQHGPCKRQGYLAQSNTTALSVFNVPCFNYNMQYTDHRLEGAQTAPLFTLFTT